MASARQRLAKLTPPRLHAPVARERLFRRLDELRARPVVWITGPPGAGKTTLAAAYLQAAQLRPVWYQMDPADGDPATFFFYLRQAVAAAAPGRSRPLPLLTPEYLPDLPGFARRFFRDAFLQLAPQTLLVLDNYHEVAPESPLHAVLAAAIAEIPPDANLIVASRADPPPSFAAAVLNGTLSILSWDEIKLTAEESEAVALARGIDDVALARRLHLQTDGWFAGLALLLERARVGASTRGVVRAEALEIVFDFFAQAIFDGASAPTQRVLLHAALLPRVTADLIRKITGDAGAVEHLDALYRRHLFVERTRESEPTWQFHALFRAFLRHRAQSALSRDERTAIAATAAAALEATGERGDAFMLWLDAGDTAAAERTLLAAAPALLAQGRWRTVLEWLDLLPPAGVIDPWLDYWRGRAVVFEDRVAARAILELSHKVFLDRHDRSGQLMSAAAILEALFFHYRDFRAMDAWIERIAALLAGGMPDLGPEAELRVHSGLLMAAASRAPDHAILATSRARVEALLEGPFDANLKVLVATALHFHENTTLDVTAAELAVRVARPLLAAPEVTAHTAGYYLSMEGYTEYVHGRYGSALARYDEADRANAELGVNELAVNISHWRALTQRRAGLINEAEATLRRVEAMNGSEKAGFAPRQFIRACLAFDRGRFEEVVPAVLAARSVTEASGQFIGTMLVGTVSANLLVGAGEFTLAAEFLERLRRHVAGPVTDHYLAAVELDAAWLAHRMGDPARRDECLLDALRRARDWRARERLRWYPNALAALLPVAIEEGIEPDRARDLARVFGIVPERLDLEQWPWRIRVYTLGNFEIRIDDAPLVFGRKAPRRTLAALKAIIAFGGRDVGEAHRCAMAGRGGGRRAAVARGGAAPAAPASRRARRGPAERERAFHRPAAVLGRRACAGSRR